MNKIYFAALLCIHIALNTHAQTTVILTASADNTIYQDNKDNSNGAGQNFFAGNTGGQTGSSPRRALLKFDLSTIPAGALVTSASLSLVVNRTQAGNESTTIHKVLASWGEGTSNAGTRDGGGTAATTDDATWTNRLHPGTPWGTPGGDFVATASATTIVGASGAYIFTAPTVVADIQSWLTDPATNFGWIVKGNEGGTQTAKRFASRQNSSLTAQPHLSITYTTSTVPIILTSFSAKETSTGSLLTWQTAQEINNDFFLVQHSLDGRNFSTIGKVKGNGNKTDVSNYFFRHEGTTVGRHFYRLAQTDISGKIQYSAIRAIYLNKESSSLQVAPNPVRDKIILTSSLAQAGARFNILNSLGATVISGQVNPAGINVKTLLSGTYYLRLQQQDGSVRTGVFLKK